MLRDALIYLSVFVSVVTFIFCLYLGTWVGVFLVGIAWVTVTLVVWISAWAEARRRKQEYISAIGEFESINPEWRKVSESLKVRMVEEVRAWQIDCLGEDTQDFFVISRVNDRGLVRFTSFHPFKNKDVFLDLEAACYDVPSRALLDMNQRLNGIIDQSGYRELIASMVRRDCFEVGTERNGRV